MAKPVSGTREGNLEALTRYPLEWHNPQFMDPQSLDAELVRQRRIEHAITLSAHGMPWLPRSPTRTASAATTKNRRRALPALRTRPGDDRGLERQRSGHVGLDPAGTAGRSHPHPRAALHAGGRPPADPPRWSPPLAPLCERGFSHDALAGQHFEAASRLKPLQHRQHG